MMKRLKKGMKVKIKTIPEIPEGTITGIELGSIGTRFISIKLDALWDGTLHIIAKEEVVVRVK